MFKLNYSHIRDPHFSESIWKISNHTQYPTKVCMHVAKIKKALDKESEIANKDFISLVKQFAVLDEKGNFVPLENRPGTFQIPEEKKSEWDAVLITFHSKEFEVPAHKLRFEDIAAAKLSPEDLLTLEPILEELPELETT